MTEATNSVSRHGSTAMQLLTLARWLARKAVKAQWRRQGRKVQYVHPSEITKASNAYLGEHMAELLMEAAIRHMEQQRLLCGTALETQLMKERWRRLVKEAIRDKGGKVNSIAPSELQRLVKEYLAQNPERRWNVHNS